MSFILRILSWLARPRSGPRARWVAANENAAPKAVARKQKAVRPPVVVHVMGHQLSVSHVGHLSALDLWNLSDPARVAVLYLQHGRRLRLPAPQAIVDFGKAVRRSRSSD